MNTAPLVFIAAADSGSSSSSSSMLPFEIGLLIFMIVFVAISIWVIFARRGAFDRHSRIPLQDDPIESHRSTTHGRHAHVRTSSVQECHTS